MGRIYNADRPAGIPAPVSFVSNSRCLARRYHWMETQPAQRESRQRCPNLSRNSFPRSRMGPARNERLMGIASETRRGRGSK